MSTIVKEAMDEIISRLEAITVSSGYNTDSGDQVYAGIRVFQDDVSFPVITVFTGSEFVEKLTYNSYRSDRTINIECYVKDEITPTISLEQLIEDVQQAMEQADISLGGIVEVLDYTGIEEIELPDGGSNIAGVRITYLITYQRQYGD